MPIINIGSKLDAKGFKQADTALTKLNKSGQNLSRTLGVALGGAAILAYAKNAGKAFAEDEKAAASLGRTLENLGLAFGSNAGTINGFISRLERQTGVLDDELRPAMDRFLRATGDVTKSQDLLNLSLDIAAGTGKSVTQVSQSLQKAYLGQTQAIGRLGVGLTKAEITSSSFEEISARLSTLFAGQATTAAEGYAGSLAKLQVAANNAKEIIGGGLFDAISALGGGDTNNATGNIEKLATGIADTLRNVGELMARLKSLKPVLIAFGIAAAAAFFPVTTAIVGVIWLLGDLNKALKKQEFGKGIIPKGMGNISMTTGSQDTQRSDQAAALEAAKNAKKLAAEEAKRQKAAEALAKKSAKAQQDLLKMSKAKAIFDMQKIQIEAALKGNISKEERIRLLLMKAIANENISDIEKYTKLLTDVQNKVTDLQKLLEGLNKPLPDPFAGWTSVAGNTMEAIKQVSKEMFTIPTIIQESGREWSSFASLVNNTVLQPNFKEWSSSFSPGADNPFIPVIPDNPNNGNGNKGGGSGMREMSITVNGALDPVAVANQIKKVLENSADQVGNNYGLGTGSKDVQYIV
jgi:hypothetical protein